VLTSAKAFLFW